MHWRAEVLADSEALVEALCEALVLADSDALVDALCDLVLADSEALVETLWLKKHWYLLILTRSLKQTLGSGWILP